MENQSLVLDLVEWVNKEPRNYSDVMDAWRTSCPRLTVWEDAVDFGLVERKNPPRQTPQVCITRKGKTFLREKGRLG